MTTWHHKWPDIAAACSSGEETSVGFTKMQMKPWISDSSWKHIENRWLIKNQLHSTLDPAKKTELDLLYKSADSEVEGTSDERQRSLLKGDFLRTIGKFFHKNSNKIQKNTWNLYLNRLYSPYNWMFEVYFMQMLTATALNPILLQCCLPMR